MIKKLLIFVLPMILTLSLILPSISTFAAETTSKNSTLSGKEISDLMNKIGHSKNEIDNLPIDVARELLNNNAKIIDSHVQYAEINDSNNNIKGSISSSTLKLTGTAYQVTSDRSGQDKFYIYANFLWLNTPSFVLVDKMTFGFPNSTGFYLPISNGVVTQHQNRYSHDIQGNGIWSDYPINYSPKDWEPNAGVSGEFDLRAGTSLSKHKGYMGQYIYVPVSNNGTMNIKIVYGHKRISGSISVDVFPAGLSILPSTTVDTIDYALSINY